MKVVQADKTAAKVVPPKSSSATVPTPKPKSISSQVSVRSSRSDLTVSVKDSTSRMSINSIKSQSKYSLANAPELNKEALRWEFECENSDDEEERIKQYKLNRRKRYLAASNKKYSDWLKTLHESIAGGAGNNTVRQEKSGSSSVNKSNGYEGLVPGLGPPLSMRNPPTQVLLNS